MNATQQMQLVLKTMEDAKAKGKTLSIVEAQRLIHRQYITKQLWNKYGVTMKGFLVIAGLTTGEKDGIKMPDKRFYNVLNRYLICENKLSGESGRILRDKMDSLQIDYRNSPTFPVAAA